MKRFKVAAVLGFAVLAVAALDIVPLSASASPVGPPTMFCRQLSIALLLGCGNQ